MFHCSAAASVSPLELASSDIQVPRPARAFLPIPSMVGATTSGHAGGGRRARNRGGRLVAQLHLMKAVEEMLGFFQVVNHGVPASLLAETLRSVRRFHESRPEAKTPYYTCGLARSSGSSTTSTCSSCRSPPGLRHGRPPVARRDSCTNHDWVIDC
jgi:hypothetical protein